MSGEERNDRSRPPVPGIEPKAGEPSAARSKTVRHLRKLLLAGAATGAAGSLTGCPVVCDPLPPPMRCTADPDPYMLWEHLYPNASWHDDGTSWLVRVSITYTAYSGDDPVTFTGAPTVTGGTLQDHTIGASSLEFTLLPDSGATTVEAEVPLDCDGSGALLHFSIDVTAPAVEGGYLGTSLITG